MNYRGRSRGAVWLSLLGATVIATVGCKTADERGADLGSLSDGAQADAWPPQVCEAGPSCPPAAAPGWQLTDFQPKSPRSGQTYGLEAFRGRPLLVALLSAG
ncbi:MAG: hypothetical protein H6707_15395 [Deltaproteobacteria bacterium]|nr:hypothetical protein [Deltaproteobacteria bacterium]